MVLRRPLIALLALAWAAAAMAQEPPELVERRIKAAFVYKFAAFIDWPVDVFTSPASPFVIGVVGANALAGELEQAVVGRDVGGRPIKVRRLEPADTPGKCCQMVFVGRGAAQRDRILADAGGKPVLTITDDGASHPAGSVINFVSVADRVRFDIARDAAERNGLQLRAQLLKVARTVSP